LNGLRNRPRFELFVYWFITTAVAFSWGLWVNIFHIPFSHALLITCLPTLPSLYLWVSDAAKAVVPDTLPRIRERWGEE